LGLPEFGGAPPDRIIVLFQEFEPNAEQVIPPPNRARPLSLEIARPNPHGAKIVTGS